LQKSISGQGATRWYSLVRPTRRGILAGLVTVLVLFGTLFAVYRADAGAFKAAGQAARLFLRPDRSSDGWKQQRQFDLIRDQLRAQVPPDHTIYRDHLNDPSGLWTQRLAEFATMARLHLTDDPAHADYAVTLVPDRSAPQGLRLVARKLR
jgi:hypothetical protein